MSEFARFVWLLPGLAMGELAEFLRLADAPIPIGLPNLAFTVALLAVAGMLAARFSRAHYELNSLRVDLEERVATRTAALAQASREAHSANAAKSRFVANVSHELRTPLSAVIGFSNVLLQRAARTKGVLGEGELDFLRRVRTNGEHLLALVDGLLDLSLIETGTIRLQLQEVDLRQLVTRLLAELSPQAATKGLHLEAMLPADLAPIHSDPVRMRQILTNLVDNGLKFTETGTVTVAVHAVAGRPRFMEVIDTGIGIPTDRIPQVLRPFSQVDDSASRRHHGMGLGLAIVKGLCDVLAYELTLESELGQGTRARIDLEPAAPGQYLGHQERLAETTRSSADVPVNRLSLPELPVDL